MSTFKKQKDEQKLRKNDTQYFIMQIYQFTVSYTNISVFTIQFWKLYLQVLALFLMKDYVSYKKKLTSLLLQNLVMGQFKIFSKLTRELVWILANWEKFCLLV